VAVSNTTGEITVAANAPVGSFKIQVVGTIISTGLKQGVTVTLVGIKNTPPYLEQSFID